MMHIIFERVITAIITLSVISVFVAIFIDFQLYNRKSNAKKSKKSIVATGSMIGFFLIYYLVLRLRIGEIDFFKGWVVVLGTVLIVCGAVINILGRIHLKDNWANHIKIYDQHKLVNTGVYKIVRHPLYASIMLMMFGGSIAYRNYLSFLLTAFIFIPFMAYRARQEEKLLLAEFEEYQQYKNKVGMFFPKIWR